MAHWARRWKRLRPAHVGKPIGGLKIHVVGIFPLFTFILFLHPEFTQHGIGVTKTDANGIPWHQGQPAPYQGRVGRAADQASLGAQVVGRRQSFG